MADSSPTAANPFVPVQKADIAAFADKLAQWGATLSSKENALVQTLVARARGLVPDDVKQYQLRVALGVALETVYRTADQAWSTDGDPDTGWARVDPVWYKAGPTDSGEQIDFTVRITAQSAPAAPVTSSPSTTATGAPVGPAPLVPLLGSSAAAAGGSKLPPTAPPAAAAASPTPAAAPPAAPSATSAKG